MSAASLGLIAALLTGIAILGAIAPVLDGRRASKAAGREDPDDRRITILRRLRDLELDRLRGALTDADYTTLRARMEATAVRLIRDAAQPDAAVEIASALRATRSRVISAPRSGVKGRTSGGRKRGLRTKAAVPAPSGRRTWITGVVIAGVVTIGAAIALVGATNARLPGGFITGGTSLTTTADDPAALVAQDPGNVEARLELAQRDLETGKVSDATKQYLAVLNIDPKNPEARTRLALLLYQSGDAKTALKGLDAVLADDPTWPEALFVKGVVLLNGLNRPADAIAPLKQYLAIDPTGPYSSDAKQLIQEAGG